VHGRPLHWFATSCGDYGNLSAHKLGCQLGKSIVLALRPAVFDRGSVRASYAGKPRQSWVSRSAAAFRGTDQGTARLSGCRRRQVEKGTQALVLNPVSRHII
jgi:hypothetical protein